MKKLLALFDDLEFIEAVGYIWMFFLGFATLIMFIARV